MNGPKQFVFVDFCIGSIGVACSQKPKDYSYWADESSYACFYLIGEGAKSMQALRTFLMDDPLRHYHVLEIAALLLNFPML